MNDIIKYTGDGCRLDKFLVSKYQSLSRARLQKLVKEGDVLVNGNLSKNNYQLEEGDEISIVFSAPKESKIQKENIELDIVYEDSDIIVVNKPSGMVVHPAIGNRSGTLVNALMYHCNDLSGIGGEIRAGIVHRLDKETSGLMVACKNDNAHLFLSEEFRSHRVNKIYTALCYGVIPNNLGKINAPIGRDENFRLKMAVSGNGKESITNFKVLKRYDKYSLLELKLETGRTHQIRVHLKYIGHPIVGDSVYGPKKVIGNKGQLLHSKKLGFIHPRTKKYMEFETSLPEKIQKYIDKLENGEVL